LHTEWEESELFFVNPNSPLAAELYNEMELSLMPPPRPPMMAPVIVQ